MELVDKELVHLVRLALEGKADDVAMMARRIAAKIRVSSPDTAEKLVRLARSQKADRATRESPLPHMPVDLETRLELAKFERDLAGMPEPIWTPSIKSAMLQVVDERQNEEALAQVELHPTRSMLFVGPPGVGKTLSAKWLASRLGVPLMTLDLAAVMSSFLGRTGNNLRNVLDHAKSVGCVLLLDEFDAIAKRRDDAIEVGELKRLVTVLLQEIDNWPSSGILIAATNHSELLDPAIWRRFDVVVQFGLPDADGLRLLLDKLLANESPKLREILALVLSGSSYSDVEREILRAKRRAVLEKKPLADSLDELIKDSLATKKPRARKAIAMNLIKVGYSRRQAHDLTGVSRDTIRKEERHAEGAEEN